MLKYLIIFLVGCTPIDEFADYRIAHNCIKGNGHVWYCDQPTPTWIYKD